MSEGIGLDWTGQFACHLEGLVFVRKHSESEGCRGATGGMEIHCTTICKERSFKTNEAKLQ
jgi:hypothetical protein